MEDKEFQAKMEKIYAYNRQLKSERVELSTLRMNEQQIREAMQKLTRLPKLSEAMEAIKQIREVLGL